MDEFDIFRIKSFSGIDWKCKIIEDVISQGKIKNFDPDLFNLVKELNTTDDWEARIIKYWINWCDKKKYKISMRDVHKMLTFFTRDDWRNDIFEALKNKIDSTTYPSLTINDYKESLIATETMLNKDRKFGSKYILYHHHNGMCNSILDLIYNY